MSPGRVSDGELRIALGYQAETAPGRLQSGRVG